MARLVKIGEIAFDFSEVEHSRSHIENLSGVAIRGDIAWTVSDERATFECFRMRGGRFELVRQFSVDQFFPDLPKGEVDLEAIDWRDDGALWLCGSHSSTGEAGNLEKKPSRRLLGALSLSGSQMPERVGAMPFQGEGSLREILRAEPALSDSMQLPSKGNGLDIEGLAVLDGELCLGLRGPVMDGKAVLVSLERLGLLPGKDAKPRLELLDLGGLAVRDLCREGNSLLILAGPMASDDGPFRIYRHLPYASKLPELIHEWQDGKEHPEGVSLFQPAEQPGLLVVYDDPSGKRVRKDMVTADWFAL